MEIYRETIKLADTNGLINQRADIVYNFVDSLMSQGILLEASEILAKYPTPIPESWDNVPTPYLKLLLKEIELRSRLPTRRVDLQETGSRAQSSLDFEQISQVITKIITASNASQELLDEAIEIVLGFATSIYYTLDGDYSSARAGRSQEYYEEITLPKLNLAQKYFSLASEMVEDTDNDYLKAQLLLWKGRIKAEKTQYDNLKEINEEALKLFALVYDVDDIAMKAPYITISVMNREFSPEQSVYYAEKAWDVTVLNDGLIHSKYMLGHLTYIYRLVGKFDKLNDLLIRINKKIFSNKTDSKSTTGHSFRRELYFDLFFHANAYSINLERDEAWLTLYVESSRHMHGVEPDYYYSGEPMLIEAHLEFLRGNKEIALNLATKSLANLSDAAREIPAVMANLAVLLYKLGAHDLSGTALTLMNTAGAIDYDLTYSQTELSRALARAHAYISTNNNELGQAQINIAQVIISNSVLENNFSRKLIEYLQNKIDAGTGHIKLNDLPYIDVLGK